MSHATDIRFDAAPDAPELRSIDANGHMPAKPDPERERWAAYWQDMRTEALSHVGGAFDHIAQCFEAGETEGIAAIAMFCAEESHGSVYRAIIALITRFSCEYQISMEIHRGYTDMDGLVDTAHSVLTVTP